MAAIELTMEMADFVVPAIGFLAGLFAREIFLHTQIASMKKDIQWIKKRLGANKREEDHE
jgi:hypothetical protein